LQLLVELTEWLVVNGEWLVVN
jgi:hypothetical protein